MKGYPSKAGLFSAAELAKMQAEMEERLSRKLKVASAREEILSGFLFTKPLGAATRRQVELYVRVMAINEEAGQARLGQTSEQNMKLFRLIDEADDLLQEFRRLDQE